MNIDLIHYITNQAVRTAAEVFSHFVNNGGAEFVRTPIELSVTLNDEKDIQLGFVNNDIAYMGIVPAGTNEWHANVPFTLEATLMRTFINQNIPVKVHLFSKEQLADEMEDATTLLETNSPLNEMFKEVHNIDIPELSDSYLTFEVQVPEEGWDQINQTINEKEEPEHKQPVGVGPYL